jgi:O-glycosyl hydrolase
LIPHRERLAQAAARFPQWKLWQSEYCVMERGRDLGMDTALDVARIIHCDLTIANASAWQWWLALAGEDYKSGLIYTDYQRAGDRENILESKTLWALGNYSRFIRPGMVRIGCAGPQEVHGVMASAFVSPDSRRLVAVLINMSSHRQHIRLETTGAAESWRFTPYTTSARESLRPGKPVRLRDAITFPPRSIVTLVGESQ